MSNPTELLDLDRLEATAKRHAENWHEFMQVRPQEMVSLIAAARRAQPEGEAPQAEPVAWRFREYDDREKCHSRTWCITMDRAAIELYKRYDAIIEPLYLAPAAQHADSGAPAASIRQHEALEAAVDECYPKQDSPHASVNDRIGAARIAFRRGYRAALAAQSQGAQPTASVVITLRQAHRLVEFFGGHDASITVTPPRADWGDMPAGLYAFCTEYPEDGSEYLGVTEVDDELTRLDERGSAARASLAAKAEAPTHCDPAEGFCAACRQQERAQQAAAPGALDLMNADEMAALRRFDETCQDGEGYDVPKTMMQRLAAIGVVRRTSGSYYETTDFGMRVLDQPAPSAPGTPEAPANVEKALRELMAIVRIHSRATDENFAWAEMQYAEEVLRAAQLDGGQGEGDGDVE